MGREALCRVHVVQPAWLSWLDTVAIKGKDKGAGIQVVGQLETGIGYDDVASWSKALHYTVAAA
jgi:hypothetical protein